MKNMRLCLIALMSITALLLASCAAVPGSTTIPTSTGSVSVGGEDLMAAVKAAPNQGAIQVPEPDFLTGISRFSATLLLESGKNKGNVMVSPLSVFLALAMTVNGADSDTRDDMLKVLTDGALTVDQVNEVSRNLIGLLEQSEPKTQVAIANSIWFRQGFKPFQPFLQANADYYGAGARSLDFSSDSATEAINGWVEQETMGLIEKIVSRISPTTVMYLINTVYFKSDWQEPFLKHETRAQTFQTPDGGIEVDFMHRTAPMAYFTGQDAIGVALPYANTQYAFFALLPDNGQGPRGWLSQQDPAGLFGQIGLWMAQKANFTVSLALPKFEASYEDVLNNELQTLGMAVAFDGGSADFSRLNEARSKGLYISEVRHKTVIRVDEKGTEAAAATSVAIDESAVSSDVELVFDHPFLYGILDTKTGLPLFVGILEDPAGD